ncbi:TIGR02452 family protein [Dawidia soli]|uniref:TIGR02452 family protein n=1 Tax=Dawidia soli TaxID=2782352 RepID=A0AAP2D818_9BACT|nr:TIGR02452 family protein [Dawidia soli]MBT1687163.1 TIGR02452 family protein [Dawidia soli]
MKKTTRIQIAEDSLRIIKQGHYINTQGETVSIREDQQRSVASSIHYTESKLDSLTSQIDALLATPPTGTTHFEVTGATSLEASQQLVFAGAPSVMCLNFASAKNPGGGFLNGSQAQEESIARSSGLYESITHHMDFYQTNRALDTCLYTDAMIYSPDVPVWKDDDGNALDNYYRLSIITSPAVNAGAVSRNEPDKVVHIAPIMLRRMEKVLAVSLLHGHKTLVLGAWGCGVFQNDPEDVARYFAQHLLEGKFKNRFERIVFAIKSNDERFIQPFRRHFA